jgi:NADH dehydrogenase [ubiquinone] 1 alpha subcomplex assembly factor 7
MTAADDTVAALARRIIAAQGPISIAAFMRLASTAVPESYYRSSRSGGPFGREGDFVTAPEMSQMFGELLGLALAYHWKRMGSPRRIDLVELGPGRGTLMGDLLRTWARVAPDLLQGSSITLVEASENLRAAQATALKSYSIPIRWSDSIPDRDRPFFLVANEFFDALPVRQFVRTDTGWRERLVNWSEARGFHDVLGPLVTAVAEPRGDFVEHSQESLDWIGQIGRRVAGNGGLALIVDYASLHGRSSLRGISMHRKASPLARLGAIDLSAGVDFAALTVEARRKGAAVSGPIAQGAYFRALGIEARHAQLIANALPGQQRELDAAYARLTAARGMGDDFRVLAIAGPADPPPFGFPAKGD